MMMTPYLLVVLHAALALVAGSTERHASDLRVYRVDRETSGLWVVVHRAGLLSFLGHEHAVVPAEWSAELCLAEDLARGSHATLVMQTAALVIDSDSARALAGMGGGPDEEARREIQGRMLDSAYLAAEQHPEIRLNLFAVEPAQGDRVDVEGAITLRGVTREFDLPVSLERADGGDLGLSGSLRIRLRDFGMEPESKVGLVKVSNDVDLHFDLELRPTDLGCVARTR